ncbi:MAG: hypothetical protein AAFP82_02880 [Bacteroidota bacterium]
MQLYEGVRRSKFQSDDEAIISLYGSLKHKYKYSKLKYDLRKRLYNTLHLVELDSKLFDDDVKTFLECQKAWTAIRFLIFFQAYQAAFSILEKYFPKMLNYEFTVMIVEGARLLRKYYSSFKLDVKKLNYYDNLISEQLSLYAAEVTLDGYYNLLISKYVEDKSPKEEVTKMATDYLDKIDLIYPKTLSSSFLSIYNLVKIIKYMSQYDYEKAVEVCNEAIEILQERNVKRKLNLMLIYSQAINCHLQLRQYDLAEKKCVETFQYYLEEGEFNWFKTKELQLQNAIYSKSYQKAYAIYQESVNHKSFAKLSNSFKEEWRIYRAYLQILLLLDLVEPDVIQVEKTKFRLHKFLNEVATFSKDKKGRNITILVAQLVLFILQEQYNKVIDRMEAIEKYINRHLHNDYHHRTNFFVKIIKELVKAGFESRMVQWNKIDELKEALSQKPFNVINPNYDLEIIRYEQLVRFVTDFISVKKVYS